MQVAEDNTRKIEIASEAYRPGSVRSATLYFVLNDLAAVDPMYQFSLDAYVELFQTSLARSSRNERVDERLRNIMDFHTYSTFKYTSRWDADTAYLQQFCLQFCAILPDKIMSVLKKAFENMPCLGLQVSRLGDEHSRRTWMVIALHLESTCLAVLCHFMASVCLTWQGEEIGRHMQPA